MASELKQKMRRHVRCAPSVAIPSAQQGVQTLELSGRLKLKLGNKEMLQDDPFLADKRVFVGAWVGRREFVYGERAADGAVSLRVPVDTAKDVNMIKFQIYCYMQDPSTRLSKPFPVAESHASLSELGSGKEARIEFKDPILGLQPSVLKLTAKAAIDTSRLQRSALFDVKKNNDIMTDLIARVDDVLKKNQVRVPKVTESFVSSVAFLPSGGNDAMGIPPVMVHYSMLSRIVDGVDRHIPHAVLAYYLQLVLTHEGLTIDQANALEDSDFAKLAGDVLWGVTHTAGGFPYQRDCGIAPTIQIDPKNGFVVGVGPITSEDIGLPFAASNFLARDLTPHPSPDLSRLASVTASDADPAGVFSECAAVIAAGDWPEQNVALGIDDCETSGMAGKLAANTVRDKDMSPEAFARGLGLGPSSSGPRVFKSWTESDVHKASSFFTRLQGMLRSGSLNISLVVGLAGGAAATVHTTKETGSNSCKADGPRVDEMEGLGGHCFAVLRHVGADDRLYVRLLEGTSCVKVVRDPPGPPGFVVEMGPQGGRKGGVMRMQLPLGQLLSVLGAAVSEEIRFVNEVIGGGMDPDEAEAVAAEGRKPIAGFLRPTLVTRCLHSLDPSNRASSEIGFYKWCLFTGLAGSSTDVGSMPLDTAEYDQCLSAGCRPAALASAQLRGVGIEVSQEDFVTPCAVLNEVWPPIATDDQFHAVLNLWAPLPSLSTTNADLSPYRREGVPYETITCMEAAASPALNEVMYRLKAALARLANKINLARKDSDHITMSVARIGTGVDVTLHVPCRPPHGVGTAGKERSLPVTLTFIKSLREAKAQMGWPDRRQPQGGDAKKGACDDGGY